MFCHRRKLISHTNARENFQRFTFTSSLKKNNQVFKTTPNSKSNQKKRTRKQTIISREIEDTTKRLNDNFRLNDADCEQSGNAVHSPTSGGCKMIDLTWRPPADPNGDDLVLVNLHDGEIDIESAVEVANPEHTNLGGSGVGNAFRATNISGQQSTVVPIPQSLGNDGPDNGSATATARAASFRFNGQMNEPGAGVNRTVVDPPEQSGNIDESESMIVNDTIPTANMGGLVVNNVKINTVKIQIAPKPKNHVFNTEMSKIAQLIQSTQVPKNLGKTIENWKCRRVYGIGQRNLWCSPCRWKKACARVKRQTQKLRKESA